MITLEETLEALTTGGKADYDYYNLPVFTIGGAEYAIAADEDEANEACKEYIKETIWAFNADFLSNHIESLEADDIERLRGDRCEDANEALRKLIDDFDEFVDDAITTDGLGHFLSCYDYECLEVGDFHLFRIN